jgi:enamine deaminase RidA (YjgF/YER057c/UK114 family)
MISFATAALCSVTVLFTPLVARSESAAIADVQRSAKPDRDGTAPWVRVSDVPLVFTGQVAAANAAAALEALGTTLERAGSSLDRVVRLNAYVADDTSVASAESEVTKRFVDSPVAFTLVRTPLANAQARVAFDAVATTSRAPANVETLAPDVAIMPAGGKLFISGQAERGADVASAVKLTLAGLHRSLAHLGLKKSDVVQVKAFIQPFADHAAAAREIAASFDGGPVPTVVFIEWISNVFAEIELVASARTWPPPAGDRIAHSYLPWLNKSPRYSHVCHVSPGVPLIFVGAIDGAGAGEGRAQMAVIFERLGSTLFEAGSSYRYLAKATYYFSDRTARAVLNDVRDVYYDPTRAPAASAIDVKTLGPARRGAMLDMIAVPLK